MEATQRRVEVARSKGNVLWFREVQGVDAITFISKKI